MSATGDEEGKIWGVEREIESRPARRRETNGSGVASFGMSPVREVWRQYTSDFYGL